MGLQIFFRLVRLGVTRSKSSSIITRAQLGLPSLVTVAQHHPKNYSIYSPPIFSRTFDKYQNNVIAKRFKKKRAQSSKTDDAVGDDDDEEEEDLAGENPLLVDDLLGSSDDGSEHMTIDVGSTRLDAFSKVAFSMSRAKVEELFYKGDIYINGERPSKKSIEVAENDEVDVVKHINPENNKLVDVRRAIVVRMPDKTNEQGRMKITIKRWMDLTIEAPAHRKND